MSLIVSTTLVSSLIGIVPSRVTPLTTTFTPAPFCAERWYQERHNSPTIHSDSNDRLYATCQPANNTNVAYSPGLCPSGQSIVEVTEYMTLPEASDSGNRLWKALCCQSGLTMYGASCRSSFSTPFVAYAPLTLQITSTDSDTTVTTQSTVIDLLRPGPTTVSNMTTLARGVMAAEPVEIYWKLDDLASFGPEYAASLARALKVQGPVATSSPTTEASVAAAQGLSPAAKAGISLGTVFGVAFVALGVYFVVIRGRRMKEDEKVQERESESMLDGEEQGNEHGSTNWVPGGMWKAEVDGTSRPREMNPGPIGTTELPADFHDR